MTSLFWGGGGSGGGGVPNLGVLFWDPKSKA